MLGLLAFTSCVDDEGCNTMSDVNEAKIEGIEDSYYKVADVENPFLGEWEEPKPIFFRSMA